MIVLDLKKRTCIYEKCPGDHFNTKEYRTELHEASIKYNIKIIVLLNSILWP